jgi:hypothetical protein
MNQTDLTKFRIKPNRMSWRDKVKNNALGLVGIVLLVLLCFGIYGFVGWLGTVYEWIGSIK